LIIFAAARRRKVSSLRLSVPWAEEKPQDQAEQRQQHDHDYPNQFLLIGDGALKNIDDRPDIADEYQHTPEAVSHVHHLFGSRAERMLYFGRKPSAVGGSPPSVRRTQPARLDLRHEAYEAGIGKPARNL